MSLGEELLGLVCSGDLIVCFVALCCGGSQLYYIIFVYIVLAVWVWLASLESFSDLQLSFVMCMSEVCNLISLVLLIAVV